MQDFKKLKVWEKSHAMVLQVYKVTKQYPKEELFGLSSQLRRSAVSVPSNIAIGCCRGSEADFKRFLQIAMGSASEVEYQIMLSNDLDYIETNEFLTMQESVQEVKRMLAALITKLKAEN